MQHPPPLITVDEYERMIQAGVFPKDERLALIEGRIISLTPLSPAPAGLVGRLDRLFANGTTTQLLVSVHDPIRLSRSELQPDLALLKLRDDNYFAGHPTASDVLLVIEVADPSADYDRNVTIPQYGRGGITEAWLIDLSGHTIEVYRGPGNEGYAEKKTYAPGDPLAPMALPDISLSVAEILGADA